MSITVHVLLSDTFCPINESFMFNDDMISAVLVEAVVERNVIQKSFVKRKRKGNGQGDRKRFGIFRLQKKQE